VRGINNSKKDSSYSGKNVQGRGQSSKAPSSPRKRKTSLLGTNFKEKRVAHDGTYSDSPGGSPITGSGLSLRSMGERIFRVTRCGDSLLWETSKLTLGKKVSI